MNGINLMVEHIIYLRSSLDSAFIGNLIPIIKQIQIVSIWMDLRIQNIQILDGSLMQFIATLFRISRPQVHINTEGELISIQIFLFLLNLLLFFYFPFTAWIKLKTQKIQGQQSMLLQQNGLKSMLENSVKILLQLYSSILIVTFIEIQMSLFDQELNNPIIQIFGCFNIIFLISIMLIEEIVIEQPLQLKKLNYQLYKSKLEQFEGLIVLLIIVITKIHIESNIYLMTTFILIYYTLKQEFLIFQYQSGNIKIQNFEIAIIIFNILIIITLIVDMDHQNALLVYLFPIILYIIIEIKNNVVNNILCQIKLKDPYQLLIKINILMNYEYSSLYLIQHLYLQKHKESCLSDNCYCKEEFSTDLQILLILNQEFLIKVFDKQIQYQTCLQQHFIQNLFYAKEYAKAMYYLWQFTNFQTSNTLIQNYKQRINILNPCNSQTQVFQTQQTGYFQEFKFRLLKQLAINQLNLQQNSKQKLSLDIQEFFSQEEFYKFISTEIQNNLNLKKEFLQTLTYVDRNNQYEIQLKGMRVVQEQQRLKRLSLDSYRQSKRLQSALQFFYSEVISDHYEAFHLHRQNFKDDININFSKTHYLCLEMNNQLQLKIIAKSNLSHQLFGYDKGEFDDISDLQNLLPYSFEETHKLLIQRFLIKGNSKFYRETNINYVRDKQGYLKTVQFFYDLFQSQLSFKILAFFNNLVEQCGIIFVDNSYIISGVNRKLFEILGFIKEIQHDLSYFNHKLITEIIPDFFNIEYDKQQNLRINLYTEFNSLSTQEQTKRGKKQLKINARCQKYQVNNINYYIINVEELFNEYGIQNIIVNTNIIPVESRPLSPKSFKEEQQIDEINIPQFSEIQEYILTSPKRMELLQLNKSESVKLSENIKNNLDMDQRKLNIKDQIIQQMNIQRQEKKIDLKNMSYSISSIGGFQNSKYYKLYELYNQITSSNKLLNLIQHNVLIYMSILLISLSYCIIAIVYSFNDLNRFAADIDMLSVRYELYGPINNYLASLQSLAYYQYFQSDFQSDVLQAQAYDYYVFLNTYFDIKNGFYNIHTNQYMVQFIQGEQLQLYLQTGQYGIDVMNVDLNEAINQFYQNSYQLQQGLLNSKYGIDSANWPEVTFYATNMVNMLAKIDSMVQNIYDYSNDRAELIKGRWLLIQILVCVLIGILLYISILLHSKYNQKIEFFIALISFQEENVIKQEIQRIKIIQDQLKDNNDLIFNYQFDPELKEIYLDKISKSNSQANYDKTFRQNILSRHQLTMKCFILLNVILYGIFISYVIPLNFYISNYLNNYQPSIKFYIQLCKQSTSAASAFTSRELIYNTNLGLYFFYTQDNITSWLNLFNQSLSIIDQYQDLQLTNQLLITENFTKSFNLIRSYNVCSLLTQEDLITAQFHCDNDYNGILKRGLQITLNSIHTYLQNEYIVNNFTQRTLFLPYEIEMGLIIYSALRSLIIEFKTNLASVTKDLQIFSISTSSVYIIFILLELLILKFYSDYYSKKFKLFKNMIFLVNQEQLFNDVSLERRFKQYIIQNDLL